MRKIIFIVLVGLFGIMTDAISAPWDKLPKSIQEMVLKDIGFYEPVEKSFTVWLLAHPTDNMFAESLEEQMTGEGVRTSLWRDKFFIPYGYLSKFQQTRSETGFKLVNTEDFVPTEKLRPYLRKAEKNLLGGGFYDVFYVTLAKRVLKSIDYANKWKLNGLDTWSFTFTYFYEPVLFDLPRLGPFKDKGTAMLNPATGEFNAVFEKDVGRQYGSSSFLGWDDATYTAWLEKQTVPSKPSLFPSAGVPSPKPSAATPSQPSSPLLSEATQKITIDALTKNLPYGDYNAGEFREIEKTYNVSFDDAWAATNKALLEEEKIITSDRDKGILIGQGEGMGTRYWTAVLIEKVTEDSVAIIVKNVTYTEHNVSSWSGLLHKKLKKELKPKEKQPPYVVSIEAKEYKVSGDIFTGRKEGRFFKDEKGAIVRDLALARKIAQAAWVYENIVKVPGIPASKRVSVILDTYKALRRYEVTQDILARVSVQILAATVSGGTTLTYTIPAGLTWQVVRDQFVNLKGLLSLTGRQGLKEALSKYQQMESLVAKLRPNHIDEAAAAEIKRLYDSAYVLDLPYSALLANLMPKNGRELINKALKDIGDELVKTLPLSDAALTTREVLGLQGKMNDALKTNPAFKEYYEKLNLAKRLTEANGHTIAAWAEQTIKYKE